MSEDKEIVLDDHGFPVLLAVRAPGQVAAQTVTGGVVRRGASSGNPNADPGSGRFTSASGGQAPGRQLTVEDGAVVVQQTRTIPQGLTVEQYERRQDVVRDLARELDDVDNGDIKEFLKRYNDVNASKVNIELLKKDVRAQRLDDLLDILDYQMRSRVEGMRRSRRFVRVQAPAGFTKRVFAGLEDGEVLRLVQRLEGRGWDPEDLTKHVISRITNEERRAQLEQLYGERRPKSGKRQKKVAA